MKIAILTDSGTGMTQEEAQALGMFYLPLQILCKETQYLDGMTITLRQLYDMLKEGAELTTSMPPVALIEETLKQIKEQGYEAIICIPLTSGLSSTASVVSATAKDVGISLYMIDCYSTCYIQRYLAECAQKLVDQGLDVETIVSRLQASVACSNTLIIPDDLQHLKRGGRLTPVAATLGGLLKIKPILQLNERCGGKIDVYDKVRTMSKAQQRAVATFVEEHVGADYVMCCIHADAKEASLVLQDKMREAFPNNEIYFGYIGAVISVHTGIGCLGIQYMKRVEGC